MPARFRMNWLAFAAALALGVAYTYARAETPVVLVRWPTPLNAGASVYADAAGDCFVFDAEKVACTPDAVAPKLAEAPDA